MCFPSPGSTSQGWPRPPSRLQMNSLRSALTAASPAQNHLISGRKKTSDMNYPITKAPDIDGLLKEGQNTHRERASRRMPILNAKRASIHAIAAAPPSCLTAKLLCISALGQRTEATITLISILYWCPEGDLNPHGLAACGF